MSMKPGMQIMPRPSIIWTFGRSTRAPTAMIVPSRTCTSPVPKSPMLGSMVSTLAPRIRNSLRGGRGAPGLAADRETAG